MVERPTSIRPVPLRLCGERDHFLSRRLDSSVKILGQIIEVDTLRTFLAVFDANEWNRFSPEDIFCINLVALRWEK